MAKKQIPYITRDYAGCHDAIVETTRKYYSDVFGSLDDASVGAWLIDVMSDVYDSLNYHIDRLYQETTVDNAQKVSSLQNLARTSGLRIPGKKAAICEVEISCEIPAGPTTWGNLAEPDERFCPLIRKGTLFSTGQVTFELAHDVDFKEQFNHEGISDRQMIPKRDSNGNIKGSICKKLGIAVAGTSRIFKKILLPSDVTPFMEITLRDTDILGVESVLVKQGTNLMTDPDLAEFAVDEEEFTGRINAAPVKRFFEVDNLLDQYRFGYETEYKGPNDYYQPIWETATEIDDLDNTPVKIVRGQWKRLKQKFITEYTDSWFLKIIFGAGIENKYGDIPSDTATAFTQHMMSRMLANDAMGVLPESGHTLYVLYRVGGGEMSNIAAGTLTNVIQLHMEMPCVESQGNDNDVAAKLRRVRSSIAVTNTTPSYGGKDEPSSEEIRYMIKYNSSSAGRCVTLKDYYARLMQMPAIYGQPFRIGVVEENNKVVIYTLGLDTTAHLTSRLAETVADNMKNYLSKYRMINDMVEIRSGKVINVGFEVIIYVDKTYNQADVVKEVIDQIYDYMDIRKHQMGEDVYLGDLQREISHINGVLNLVDLKCYNKVGEGYSSDTITQELVQDYDCCQGEDYINTDNQIDLKTSDYILFSDANSMFEIKNKTQDITVIVKTR